MRHKLLNLAGCTIMVLAALAPMVSAHNQPIAGGDADTNVILNGGGIEAEVGAFEDGLADLSELPNLAGAHVDNDRYSTPYETDAAGNGCHTFTGGSGQTICENRNGVSGRYVGSAFFANAVGGSSENSLFPLATVPNPANPTVGPPTFTLLPGGIFSSLTGPFCDFEIAGDGSNYDTSDETWVDAFNAVAAGGPNSVPNGLWDDGGQGGACHTTGYNPAPGAGKYAGADNTPGCPAGDYARAEDAVSGDSIWIATSCDVTKPVIGDSPSLTNCLENRIGLQRDWAGLTQCFNSTYGCDLPQYLEGQPIPAPGPGFPPTAADLPAIEACIALALTGELACNVTFTFPPTEPQIQACITNIALDIILCEPPITTSNCLPPPTTACGTDNGADVTRFGEGGAHNDAGDTETLGNGGTGRPIYDDGVPFLGGSDSNNNSCPNNVGQAFVSALTGVHVEIPRLQGLADGTFAVGDDGAAINLSLATTGWISTVTGQSEAESPQFLHEPLDCAAWAHFIGGVPDIHVEGCVPGQNVWVSANLGCTPDGANPGSGTGTYVFHCGLVTFCEPKQVHAIADLWRGATSATAEVFCNGTLIVGATDNTPSLPPFTGQVDNMARKTWGQYECRFTFVIAGAPYDAQAHCRDP
jgi:hypothetical protein